MTQEANLENSGTDQEVAIIVAAVDTSGVAGSVVELGARLARRAWQNAQLHIVHVFRTSSFDRPPPGGESEGHSMTEEARQHLEYHVRMARRQCPAPVTGHFAIGNPVDEIVRIAASLNADVIVVGAHDAKGFGRLLIGSVSESVAHKASCSVLVTRRKRGRHDPEA